MSEIKAGEVKRKSPKHGESQLQQSCVAWFRLQYPKLRLNLFAISNEGARTKINGARLKSQGMLAGTADCFLAALGVVDGWTRWGLFIEFKYGKNGQTDTQKAFEKAVKEQRYGYEVIRDFDSFKKLITEYLK